MLYADVRVSYLVLLDTLLGGLCSSITADKQVQHKRTCGTVARISHATHSLRENVANLPDKGARKSRACLG